MNVYAWSGATAWVTQSQGVDHTLGIKFQSPGGTSWSGGGSATISLDASASEKGLLNVEAFNSINYRYFHNACTGAYWRPVSVYGLLTNWSHTLAQPSYPACTAYSSGYVIKTRGSNYTFSTGISTPVGGANAQSGYNSSTSIRWDFTKPSELCGNTSQGWVSSSNAETHAA